MISAQPKKHKRLLIATLLIAILLILVLAIFPGLTQYFEYKITDSKFKIRKAFNYEPELHPSVALVKLDDESKEKTNSGLWSYDKYAKVLESINKGGATSIGSDFIFTLSVGIAGEDKLFEAMFDQNIINPYVVSYDNPHQNLNSSHKYKSILKELKKDSLPKIEYGRLQHVSDIPYQTDDSYLPISIKGGIGFVNIIPDEDGVLRRLPIVAEVDGHLAPHFYLSLLASHANWKLKNMELVSPYKLILHDFPISGKKKDIEIPLDGHGNMIINYISREKINNHIISGDFNSFSAWRILESEKSPPLKDKVVVFGDHSFAAKDQSATPLNGFEHNPMIFAMAMSNILNESFVIPLSNASKILITLIMIACLLLIIRYANVLWTGLGVLILITFYCILNFGLFIFSGIDIPLLSIIIPFIVSSGYALIFLVYETQVSVGVLEGSLRSYLSPHLMDKIKNNPDMLKLGGERKRISVMFSDIAGFTHFTDEADPAEVQLVLEEYFSEMAEIIFNNGGIIDKYMGDGVLAFFENPPDTMISAQAAIKAATGMQKKAEELNQKYTDQNRFPFAIRVAIATGYAKVGNIGPKEKVDYTIIGSVVNLCSRLEGLGENGDVVFDEETYYFIKDDYQIQDIGTHSLKGFEKSIQVYKLKA